MTFKELREGNQYFILHKTDKPFCEIGSVIGVSNLRPKQNMVNGYQAMQPEMIIDISVKVGDDTVKLSSVPADKSIADYRPENGEKTGVVLRSGNDQSRDQRHVAKQPTDIRQHRDS